MIRAALLASGPADFAHTRMLRPPGDTAADPFGMSAPGSRCKRAATVEL